MTMNRTVRVIALCLALILALAQIASASAVLDRAVQIISKMETNGNYGSVGNDTNGSPSVGILQWNNGRAVSLLKKIISDDAEGAQTLLGDALYTQLSQGKTSVWSSKTLSAAEKKAVGALLKSDAGVKCQNAQAETDVSSYINKAKGLGILDLNAQVYYADIAHQVGSGAVKKYAVKAAELAGGYGKITLKNLYQAALVYATHTKSRRTKVYNMLVANPVEGSAEEAPALPEKVAISPSDAQVLYLGGTLKLAADVSPSGAAVTYAWSSSSEGIVQVSDGVVTPKRAGSATITVKTQNGKADTVKVTVKPVLVKSVAITGDGTMRRGQKQTLKAVCTPDNATVQDVRWRSANSRIVAVNSKGVVLARMKGKTTIYCMTKDGTKKIGKLVVKVS
jgi:uncharacterized protein YjdB